MWEFFEFSIESQRLWLWGWQLQGFPRAWGYLSPLAGLLWKALCEPEGYFAVANWRTKVGTISRKEGNLGFLSMILKTVPNLIFMLPLHELSSWLISDPFLPLCLLSCHSRLSTKAMGKLPQPFQSLSWSCLWSLRPALSSFPSLPTVTTPASFHSDHLQNL